MVSSRVRPMALAVGLGTIAAVAFLLRALRHGTPAVDFAPVWLAGRMWNDGVDPYTAAFVPYARRYFPPPAHLPVSWVYPAQWMGPARLLALIAYDQAKIVWLALSLTALALSALLLWRAADRLTRPPSIGVKAGAILFLLTMEATGGSLFLVQTGFLVLSEQVLVNKAGWVARRLPSGVLSVLIADIVAGRRESARGKPR